MAAGLKEAVGNAGPHRRLTLRPDGPFRLESGRELPAIEIACETWGEPDPDRGNTILVCPALSADAHAAGFGGSEEPAVDGFGFTGAGAGIGWWDPMIGPGKSFDTGRFHVVCMSLLGGCGGTTGPLSPRAAGGDPWGPDFPPVSVGDLVEAARAGLRELGVERLRAVTGGSLGGMQALEWAARHPEEVEVVIPIASTPALSAQGIGWNALARNAITADPDWKDGRYPPSAPPVRGLGVARMAGHLTYLSRGGMEAKFGRRLQDRDDFSDDVTSADFQVESYLRHQAKKFTRRFDANAYLLLSRALTRFDLAARHGGGDLVEAVRRFRCRTLLLSFSSDWIYPPEDSEQLAEALRAAGQPVEFHRIETDYGHDSFLLEADRMTPWIRRFLGLAN